MLSSIILPLLPILAGTALAQSTTTATVLIPDWCITQASPTVTVVNSDRDLTTYSYSCSVDSSAVSSASAKASSAAANARSHVSEVLASLPGVNVPIHTNFARRDNCYGFGWDSWRGSACIPWEVTQGPSLWAVHYTNSHIGGLDQECTFGPGGVASGQATCTGNGRLDPGVWGRGDGTRTHTFDQGDVDRFWIRNTVAVTLGAGATGGAAQPSTTTYSGGSVSVIGGAGARQTAVQGNQFAAESTGGGVMMAMPTGLVAMAVGAGGVLFGAIAL
ncbi:hypothetical protein DE146DRAFT_293111 [Phaeosphaeria sp. MPI-PUGE-AT-0046c]|nr:hypothetical protein DE146DRAFT_293111 [Phaeosphaeria sp. MPI-PUGE-AT-0046c]